MRNMPIGGVRFNVLDAVRGNHVTDTQSITEWLDASKFHLLAEELSEKERKLVEGGARVLFTYLHALHDSGIALTCRHFVMKGIYWLLFNIGLSTKLAYDTQNVTLTQEHVSTLLRIAFPACYMPGTVLRRNNVPCTDRRGLEFTSLFDLRENVYLTILGPITYQMTPANNIWYQYEGRHFRMPFASAAIKAFRDFYTVVRTALDFETAPDTILKKELGGEGEKPVGTVTPAGDLREATIDPVLINTAEEFGHRYGVMFENPLLRLL
jgi:hypothetical protein